MVVKKLISVVIVGQKVFIGSSTSNQLTRMLLTWSFFLSVCTLISLSHEHSIFSPTLEDRDVASFRYGSYGSSHSCVTIPSNFTLCKNIGYSQMMVPNLLQHDSLQEAQFHAKQWVPLLGLQCHPDTQLFLCSLFSPICLDRPIYPCRSLCQKVQEKCEPRMLRYNYPWPSMLKCDQFPEDNDLCIRPGAANNSEKIPEPECPSCHQAHTCENIVDNFCRADFVFRAKFKKVGDGLSLEFRKGRLFKPRNRRRKSKEYHTIVLDQNDQCCTTKLEPREPYIVMGVKRGGGNVATFIMPWNGRDRTLKNAVRTFRRMDCSNPLPMSVSAAGGKQLIASRRVNGTTILRRRRRRRRKQKKLRQRPSSGGC